LQQAHSFTPQPYYIIYISIPTFSVFPPLLCIPAFIIITFSVYSHLPYLLPSYLCILAFPVYLPLLSVFLPSQLFFSVFPPSLFIPTFSSLCPYLPSKFSFTLCIPAFPLNCHILSVFMPDLCIHILLMLCTGQVTKRYPRVLKSIGE
jgi:hypothetical protein